MADETLLVAEPRESRGTGASRRLRHDGRLPGIIYGHGNEPRAITFDAHGFEQMLRHHSSDNVLLSLQLGGKKTEKVLLREVQRDTLTGYVLHADFVEVKMTEKLHVTVSTDLLGDPVGVTQSGGMLDHLLREIEVECFPGDIPEKINVDVSEMDVGESILVKNLVVDPKLTVLTDGEVAVACVLAPRVDAAEEVDEEGEEGAEEGAAQPKEGEEEKAETAGESA